MPQLRRFTVENFKCFREPTTFEFSDVNLFYGKNSAGKSSLFDAFEYFSLLLKSGRTPCSSYVDWRTVQRQFDFRRVVSDRDTDSEIVLTGDFSYEHPDNWKELIFEGEQKRVVGCIVEPHATATSLAELVKFWHGWTSGEYGSREVYEKHYLDLLPISYPPFLLGSEIRTAGVSVRVAWDREHERPQIVEYALRINGVPLVVSKCSSLSCEATFVNAGCFDAMDKDRAFVKLNPTHPVLPCVLTDLRGFASAIAFYRQLRAGGARKSLPSMTVDGSGDIDVSEALVYQSLLSPGKTVKGYVLDENEVFYVFKKYAILQLANEMRKGPAGRKLDRRVLVSGLSESMEDEYPMKSVAQGTELDTGNLQVPYPWIKSAFEFDYDMEPPDEEERSPESAFDLCELIDWHWEYRPDDDGDHEATREEKDWNAFVFHCWSLGTLAIDNTRRGVEVQSRLPPIRDRVFPVHDLVDEDRQAVNEWLSGKRGFGLGVSVLTTACVVEDLLRKSCGGEAVFDFAAMAERFLKSLHDVGKLDELQLVNQDSLPVRAEEIGTGVSQLIPVVIQAFRGGIQMFEQPELHLHAEPQLVLGDMFLDAKCQAFLETHSLPLLLRIMRRIREQSKRLAEGTGEGEEKADRSEEVTEGDPERLLADAIRVWHIRDHEGSSRAEEIRIDNEGMLIDEWPDDLFDVKFREVFGR